jgi:putative iron-only hydrogenase system regulator
MSKRIAIMGIIVENRDSVRQLNELLHEYGDIINGRMGIPFREEKLSVISVVLCADEGKISALSGKIGRLDGVQAKVTYSSRMISE